ncbi:uncharacterized protein [Linepithema humile]|uniref:uncharacterized protein n=1 Tax=Linepithema humile TaxID=83485 RepID=UPI00351EC35B
MSEIANLRKARGYIKAKLTRLTSQVSQIVNEIDVEVNKEQVETRLEKLEEIYRDFEANQRKMLEALGDFTSEDVTEEDRFEEKYFEVKSLLKQLIKQTSTDGTALRNTDAIMQLLQQQSEIIQQIGRDNPSNTSTAMAPPWAARENETLAAILSRQTEILDRVANASGSNNIEARIKLPTSDAIFPTAVLGSPTDTWDELMHMMETRFDVRTLQTWEEEIERNNDAKLVDMLEFLKKRCQTLERIEARSADKNEKSYKEGESRGKGFSATGSKQHFIAKGAINQRTASLTASLNSEHAKWAHARSAQQDNTLCHQSTDGKVSAKLEGSKHQNKANDVQSSSNVTLHHASNNVKRRQVLMATAIVEATQRNGSSTPIRVLLDSASEANFITQAAHNKLGLKRDRVTEIVTSLNEIENKIYNSCDVHVKSKCSNFEINAQCLIIPKITKNLPAVKLNFNKLQIPGNLQLADSKFYKIGPIDMLIGAEFFFDLLETGKIELSKNQLILQNTKLGWIVAGSMPSIALEGLTHKQGAISALASSLKSCEILNDNLKRFWKLENYDNEKVQVLSIDERKCEQHFERTTTRTSDGRFVLRLSFRENNLSIGNNREIAFKRLIHLERTLKSNDIIRDRYIKFMREYIELGHMSIVNKSINNFANSVYLPHHGVLKESSSSTKLRVVFDASAKNNRGVSLNDALLVGPVLQDNLVDIIVRFRFCKIALTADLQKMYRQVLVQSDDRDFQRILWRFSFNEPIKEYRLNTVTYGQACASYLAVRCLRQLAVEGSERYPQAAYALLNDTYVDGIISGANTIEEACMLQEQLSELLRERGFKAHKWCSNSEDATLTKVPIDLRESNSNLNIDANDIIRTLGIKWNPISDEF